MDALKKLKDLYLEMRMVLEKIDLLSSKALKNERKHAMTTFHKNKFDNYKRVFQKDLREMKELFRSDAKKILKKELGDVAVTIVFKNIVRMESSMTNDDIVEVKDTFDTLDKYLPFTEKSTFISEDVDGVDTEEPINSRKVLVDAGDNVKQSITLSNLRPPKFPNEIDALVLADIDEMKRTFEANCYRSSIILCGRILEIALNRKIFDITGKDLMETAPGLGLGKLIGKLREQGINMPPGVNEQIHLVNNTRIHSVHEKKDLFRPSREKTHAIILLTFDVLRHLFK